ncbi:MAG TPA: FAD-dependent thymidylate synthase [Thermoplasmata archaeon]|jgi:thymidylate synthase (FAD)|nr:FAD-dependent thymidylate synthase [Thermoplasmata archaeon]
MKPTKPLVIKIGETRLDRKGIEEMLRALGVSAEGAKRFQDAPDNGETLIELAGRVCYNSFEIGLNPNVTKIRLNPKDYFENLLRKGDGSVTEHAVISWALIGVSRILTHELARHRVGIAISQESLRYVRPRDIKFWLPDELSGEQRASMEEAVRGMEDAYRRLEDSIPWDAMDMDRKKRLTSAIRRILPDGIATNVIWSANHRTLRWVIEMRTDPAAEVEIRMVFDQIAQICKRDYPNIYQDMVRKELPDGTGTWKPMLRSKV